MGEQFSLVIAKARKNLGISQKDLARRLRKDDGTCISTSYLNDIEHGRRRPPEPLLEQFARILKLERDYLYHLVGIVPMDLQKKAVRKDRLLSAYDAFRRALDD